MPSPSITGGQRRPARRRAVRPPAVIGAAVALAAAIAAVVLVVSGGQQVVRPFAYSAGERGAFEARAAAGESHLLYANSPGGALATARRVAALRAPIAAAAAIGGVDPGVLEGVVYLESGGLPEAIAGGDPAGAAGLTQILPETGRGLLGMHIDVAASRRLTKQIAASRRHHQTASVARLEAQRRRVDARFDPLKALAATGRYLAFAQPRFGSSDLAVASYHMGIGNLANVVRAYAGPAERRLAVHVVADLKLTYAQLYFDSTPFRHVGAYRLLSSFGDNSDTYYWRVLAARDIVALYGANPVELRRRQQLQGAYGSSEALLHPPGASEVFTDPATLTHARAVGTLVAVPNLPGQRHFALDPAVTAQARQFARQPDLYGALRPEALGTLYYLADRVHALVGGSASLLVATTVRDSAFQVDLVRRHLAAAGYSLYTTGYSFDIERRYASRAQAEVFQALLNRLQALDVIAWERRPDVIHITASNRAAELVPLVQGARLSPD